MQYINTIQRGTQSIDIFRQDTLYMGVVRPARELERFRLPLAGDYKGETVQEVLKQVRG